MATTPPIGTVLNGLSDQVNGSIEQAIRSANIAGPHLRVDLYRQIAVAIEIVRNAHQELLIQPKEDVPRTVFKNIEALERFVKKAQSQSTKGLPELANEVSKFADSITFTWKKPKLKGLNTNSFIQCDRNEQIVLQFTGSFRDARREGFTPTLSLRQETFLAHETSDECFNFSIPSDAILAPRSDGKEDPALHKNSYTQVVLNIYWDSGILRPQKEVAIYSLWMAALPIYIAKVTAVFTSFKPKRRLEHFISQLYRVWADENSSQEWVKKIVDVFPNDGWSIVPKTAKLFHEKANGLHGEWIRLVSKDKIEVDVTVENQKPHVGHTSFWIEFDEEFLTMGEMTELIELYDLKWGASVTLNTRSDKLLTKVTFDYWDGKRTEFLDFDTGVPFLKLESKMDEIEVTPPCEEDGHQLYRKLSMPLSSDH